MEKKFNCYECKFRRDIAGDTHSRCAHPKVGGDEDDAFMSLVSLLGGANNSEEFGAYNFLKIQGHQHGIRSGWFNWPYNFDPTWLLNCDGFEKRE